MTLAQMISQPCVLHRTELDDDGYPVEDAEQVETVCSLQQASRDEPGDLGETSDSNWRIFFPAGTDASTKDRVEVAGVTYELVGEPWRVHNPWQNAESHVEASARLAS